MIIDDINKLNPTNDLEMILFKFKNNEIKFNDFINFFFSKEIVIPSLITITDTGFFEPFIFLKDNQSMFSAFTSAKLLNIYEKFVNNYLVLLGKDALIQLPYNFGLVINPGYDVGFDISPQGIRNIILDFNLK